MKTQFKYNASHVRRGHTPGYNSPQFEIPERTSAYIGAAAMFLCAVILALSLGASLFGVPNIASPAGDFFADAYGVLAFMIPGYFVFAGIILLGKDFRPRLIFILNCVVFPFLTLSTGFSFLRDFNNYSKNMAFFELVGRNGFSFIIVMLTMMECFIIYSLGVMFFPEAPRRKRELNTFVRSENEQDTATIHLPHYVVTPAPPAAPAPVTVTVPNPEPAVITPKITPAEPSMNDVKEAYTGAFSSLDRLNEKLENLGSDIEIIDAQFTTLDTKIISLKDELKEIEDTDAVRKTENAEEIEDLAEMEEEDLNHFEELEEPGGFDNFNDIVESLQTRFIHKDDELDEDGETDIPEKKTPVVTENKKKKSVTRGKYNVPADGILNEASASRYWIIDDSAKNAARVLTETLREFGIEAEVTGIRKGPVITSFEILPSPGVKLSKIVNLQDNIALRLAAASVRIVAPIPGKQAVGIEIPNAERAIVSFREIIEGQLEKINREGRKIGIPIVLGTDISGTAVTADLATMPHLLIAGSTGSGKSVCVNTIILSILYQCPPEDCKLILIDPKIVELKLYNDIPHLLTPVITEPKRAFQAMQYCICEMERRYACLDSLGARDIKTYNKRVKERKIAVEPMPYIVVVIDEFADLMATTGKELEASVARLAAMSRAVGIHLVLATQRPSIDVITGLIKSNIPSRIAFMVASMTDSRIIIDMPGAEKLLGKGDMLYSGIVDPFPVRLQGAFVSEDEVERVVEFVRGLGEPDYIDEEIFFDDEDCDDTVMEYSEGGDPLYDKAMEIVLQQGRASASYIQRRLKIGYNRAARLVEEMEQRGIVGPSQGSRPRELLRAV